MLYWLIWSNEHEMWWQPARSGYTSKMECAGRYGLLEASAICDPRNEVYARTHGNLIPAEVMMPAPEALVAMLTAARNLHVYKPDAGNR